VKALPASFYNRPTLNVTEELIGKVLVHDVRGRRVAGIIVEVEAYIGESDPACHAAPGPTKRNAPLYGPPGRAYVYFNYGMHYLVNAVTEKEGSPAAVLIRALEPVEGVDTMVRRRGVKTDPGGRFSTASSENRPPGSVFTRRLCSGPGNLTKALAIDLRQNRSDLTTSRLRIEDHGITPDKVTWTPRVGIRVGTDREWRCCWAGHAGVSGRVARVKD